MKITDLKMIHLRPRWMFLKIETDEGITGWGEPVVEGRARTVETAVNEFRPILIGGSDEDRTLMADDVSRYFLSRRPYPM